MPVVVKREEPVQKQPAQVQPPEEKKQPTQQVEQRRKPVRTAPAPTPTPVPSTAAKPQAKLVYAVQLGVFKSKANADALVRQYTLKGYDAYAQKTTTAKGTLYRVLVGKFDTRNKATFLMKEIKNKENVSAIVYHGKV